jgi:hypothetical protein
MNILTENTFSKMSMCNPWNDNEEFQLQILTNLTPKDAFIFIKLQILTNLPSHWWIQETKSCWNGINKKLSKYKQKVIKTIIHEGNRKWMLKYFKVFRINTREKGSKEETLQMAKGQCLDFFFNLITMRISITQGPKAIWGKYFQATWGADHNLWTIIF